jgi:hypothetical protein
MLLLYYTRFGTTRFGRWHHVLLHCLGDTGHKVEAQLQPGWCGAAACRHQLRCYCAAAAAAVADHVSEAALAVGMLGAAERHICKAG